MKSAHMPGETRLYGSIAITPGLANGWLVAVEDVGAPEPREWWANDELPGPGVPPWEERVTALRKLGFVPIGRADAWQWDEIVDETSEPPTILLIANIPVRLAPVTAAGQ